MNNNFFEKNKFQKGKSDEQVFDNYFKVNKKISEKVELSDYIRKGNIQMNDRNNNSVIENKKVTNEKHKEEKELIANYFKENKKISEKWELLDYLGSGSEAHVYKGLYKKNKKNVVMKMILLKNSKKKNVNELNIHRKLKNNNIIDFFGTIEIKKNELDCYLIEYGKHGNLIDFQKNLIKTNYMSESILCFIAYQILKGLKYLNLCKIAHLDLKPMNLIIDEYLNVKIIDFSISLDYGKNNSKEIKLPTLGTSFYMSPEVLRNDIINVNDLNKVDLFSLGVILYQLAFGYFPFGLKIQDAKKFSIIYDKIKKDLIIDNKNDYYSLCFIDFIKRLLEKDIQKRININEALNHYWIKGAEILLNEKEKIYNVNLFLSYLVTDHFINFDNYLNNYKKNKGEN